MAKKDESGKTGTEAPRKHRRGPAATRGVADAWLRLAAARHGFPDTGLLRHWSAIAGPGLGAHTRPVEMRAAKSGGATLVVACSGTAAVLVQHQSRQLIDRVNAFLGPGAVTSIKVRQTWRAPPQRPVPPAPPVLTAAEESAIAAETARVKSPDLRRHLAQLMRLAAAERKS